VTDGHDLAAIDGALATAADHTAGDRPTGLLSGTVKARGFSEVEDRPDWHGKTCYTVGGKVATRKAYRDALVAVGARDPRVVAVDAEVSIHPRRRVRARLPGPLLRDVHRRAAAGGRRDRPGRPRLPRVRLHLRRVPDRAHDFIRVGAISGVDLRLVGSHAGVEIGADGPRRRAGTLAMLRAVHGSTELYPSDATSSAALVEAMASTPGISYLRTTRGAYPVLDAGHIAAAGRQLKDAAWTPDRPSR